MGFDMFDNICKECNYHNADATECDITGEDTNREKHTCVDKDVEESGEQNVEILRLRTKLKDAEDSLEVMRTAFNELSRIEDRTREVARQLSVELADTLERFQQLDDAYTTLLELK